MSSHTEENYLKAIFALNQKDPDGATTNAISRQLRTKASSVTDMIKKLDEKSLVNYKKYKGVTLTPKGKKIAVNIIRKHRLWEVFLVDKLKFKWDEVHDIAEQLEHIKSPELTKRLEKFLEYPQFDPHGDPIPDQDGNISHHKNIMLSDLKEGESGIIVGVKDTSSNFLQYLESVKLVLGARVTVQRIIDYDHSMEISVNQKESIMVSNQVNKNLYIKTE